MKTCREHSFSSKKFRRDKGTTLILDIFLIESAKRVCFIYTPMIFSELFGKFAT